MSPRPSPSTTAAAGSATRPTFIDLFCGCGGFTLGMLRAGFDCLAAIDFNEQAVATLKANLADKEHPGLSPVRHALKRDLTAFRPAELASLIGTDRLDVIVGGPPCQGFSTARQRDGSNHGDKRLKEDPRRHLFRNFLDFVEFFQPKVFVIENVLGLRSAAGGRYFTAVQYQARILGRDKDLPGYRVHPQIERGEKLGAPQKRRRQLIVGVRADLAGYFPSELQPAARASVGAMLGDAIMDLPVLRAGGGEDDRAYDFDRRKEFFQRHPLHGRSFLHNVAEAWRADRLRNHVARPHSERDLRDFLKMAEGESSAVVMRRGVKFEHKYDTTTFKDRFTRQHRERPCSTIVAHLAKDGLMFIHPTQNRSFTPREAARVQTFPDWFVFPKARTHSFRVIGNAVPPLIGEAVGDAILRFLRPATTPAPAAPARSAKTPPPPPAPTFPLPRNHAEAVEWLDPLAKADRKTMCAMPADAFLKCWHALLWLFPDLHPENALALEHGDETHDEPASGEAVDRFGRRYTRSGWPVMLEAFGVEAWRRFEADEFSDEAFYCVAAQRAGLEARARLASAARPAAPGSVPAHAR